MISTGSSAVQIFVSGSLMYPNAEWRVVVFPDPVGPTQSMILHGFSKSCLNSRRFLSDICNFI